MKYRDKRLDADAVQFTGPNDIVTVAEFVGEPVTVVTSPALGMAFGDQAVALGDWVVKSFDGKVSKVAAADFALGFELVPQAGV